MHSTTHRLPIVVRLIHWFIMVNFTVQILYGAYMVFFVVTAPGTSGPLWSAAAQLPFEQMMTRRMYATETWIAIVGLSLYFAVTEVLPRCLSRPANEGR